MVRLVGQHRLRDPHDRELWRSHVDRPSRNMTKSGIGTPQGSVTNLPLVLNPNIKPHFARPLVLRCVGLYTQQEQIQQIPGELFTFILVDYNLYALVYLPEKTIRDRLGRMEGHDGRNLVERKSHDHDQRSQCEWFTESCEDQIDR